MADASGEPRSRAWKCVLGSTRTSALAGQPLRQEVQVVAPANGHQKCRLGWTRHNQRGREQGRQDQSVRHLLSPDDGAPNNSLTGLRDVCQKWFTRGTAGT